MAQSTKQLCTNFILPTCKGLEIVEINNLIRIEAISNYSKLFFADGSSVVVAKVLKWFEDKLPKNQFLRTHRKHIVNSNFIHKYFNGKIELYNTQIIDVSKRKRAEFTKLLQAHAA